MINNAVCHSVTDVSICSPAVYTCNLCFASLHSHHCLYYTRAVCALDRGCGWCIGGSLPINREKVRPLEVAASSCAAWLPGPS